MPGISPRHQTAKGNWGRLDCLSALGSKTLLPLPHFGDSAASGIYLVFECTARVVEAGKLLRCGPEEQHAAVADGTFGPEGAVSYRGMLFFRTTSQKLARLNNACGAFEYEVDPAGSTVSKMWEWK